MKASNWVKAIVVVGGLIGGQAFADGQKGIGTWTGNGVVFGLDGKSISTFSIELTRKAVDEQTVEMKGTVTRSTGEKFSIDQRATHDGNQFRIESSRGHGGGICYGEGICSSYEDIGNEQAVATTLIIDSSNKIRLLITELDHGKATKIIRQSLTRKP